jgi:hypothetical protein
LFVARTDFPDYQQRIVESSFNWVLFHSRLMQDGWKTKEVRATIWKCLSHSGRRNMEQETHCPSSLNVFKLASWTLCLLMREMDVVHADRVRKSCHAWSRSSHTHLCIYKTCVSYPTSKIHSPSLFILDDLHLSHSYLSTTTQNPKAEFHASTTVASLAPDAKI